MKQAWNIEGLASSAAESSIVHTAGMKLSPCVGCNACWLKTPGICGIHDGYEEILKGYLKHGTTDNQTITPGRT